MLGAYLWDPKKIVMKSHVNWGNASAQQLKRVWVDTVEDSMHPPPCANDVLEQCEVRNAVDKAPHVPTAGTPTTATFNEKLWTDSLFSDDIVALRAWDVFSAYSLLVPVRLKNPQELVGAFCNPRIGTFGPPQCIQMDEGEY